MKNTLNAAFLALATMASLPFAHADSTDPQKADACQFIRDQLKKAAPFQVVSIPAGEYICSTPVVLDRDGQILEGAGPGKTILKLADHANAPVILIGQVSTPPKTVRDITLRNLTADGNMNAQDRECWGGRCDTGGTSYIRNNAVSVRATTASTIDNVEARYGRSGGLVTERETTQILVNRLEAHHNFFDGFSGDNTSDIQVTNLNSHHNLAAGISVDNQFSHNHFDHVLLEQNGDEGIYARWGDGNSFDHTVIRNNATYGVYLAKNGMEDDKCASNYTFQNTQVDGNQAYGLWIDDRACTGTSFTQSSFAKNKSGCYRLPEGGSADFGGATCE